MSLGGAFICLVIGVLEVWAVQRLVYPALRWKHEEAKVTGSHGRDPGRLMLLVWVQGLVILPLIGLFFGRPFAASIGLK
jgi:hypothetical protein